MRIAVAQVKTLKKDIPGSIQSHLKLIELALQQQADAIFFPELSLTSYESVLAHEIVLDINDPRIEIFQEKSDQYNITIALGFPTRSEAGIRISMVFFIPDEPRKVYSKQFLHSDELPYFDKGTEQLIVNNGQVKLAPAICYESMLQEHLEKVLALQANLYIACVADSENGVIKAHNRYAQIAKKYRIPVLMSNSIGFCDNFESVGGTAVWNNKGELLATLNNSVEGLVIYNTNTTTVSTIQL